MATALLLVGGLLDTVLLAVTAPLWLLWMAGSAYLLLLAVAASLRRSSRPAEAASQRRFCLLIPAHNEEVLLGGVIDGLRRDLDYPQELWTLRVVADNCSDGTASIARAHGAEVMERFDAQRKGKGYALEDAITELLQDPRQFEAFLILDADSALSPEFLKVVNAALADGAQVVQGHYEVMNAAESWRTRLMACALALAHHVKPHGRALLGLSDGLKGNGMCFTREVLERVPWSGESVTEDIEYTLRLAEAGIPIQYAPNARVRAQMPVTASQAASQRERWEGGRYALFGRGARCLAKGLLSGNLRLADRGFELLVPPLAEMALLPCAFLVAAGVWWLLAPDSRGAFWLAVGWGATLVATALYIAIGLRVARVPAAVASALVFAPVYAVWKLALYGGMLLKGGVGGWKRTERKPI